MLVQGPDQWVGRPAPSDGSHSAICGHSDSSSLLTKSTQEIVAANAAVRPEEFSAQFPRRGRIRHGVAPNHIKIVVPRKLLPLRWREVAHKQL